MIGAHPGGIRLTRRLFEMAGITAADLESGSEILAETKAPKAASREKVPASYTGTVKKVLDLGAGTGESVCYLRTLGYDAVGIDRDVKADHRGAALGRETHPPVIRGDMTALPFPDESFDLCLAECSIAVCKDSPGALGEAYRVLRSGGSLLLSDVFFHKDHAPCLSMPEPLTFSCWEQEAAKAGFILMKSRDETALWREFFLESLWNGNADEAFLSFFQEAGKARCGYFLAWLWKGEKNGFI